MQRNLQAVRNGVLMPLAVALNLAFQVVDASSKQHWAASPHSFVNPFTLPAAEINLGHLWFVKKQFGHAVGLYSYAMELYKETGHPDPNLQTFMARAIYESRAHFGDAVVSLSRLLHLRPWDKAAKFNLALVLQGAGVHFILYFKTPAALPDDGPLKEVRSAIDSIEHAVVLYAGLKQIPEEALPVKHSVIDDQILVCHEYKEKGEEALQTMRTILEKQAIQDQINKKEWEKHLEQQAAKKRQREEEAQRHVEEQEERASAIKREQEERRGMAPPVEEIKPKRKRARHGTRKRKQQTQGNPFMDALHNFDLTAVKTDESSQVPYPCHSDCEIWEHKGRG